MINNNSEIGKLLSKLDDEQKASFLSMTTEEMMVVLFSIEMENSKRLAKVEKKQIEMEVDNREYRKQREIREDSGDKDIMNTTQKIIKAIAEQKAKEFNVGIYFRDKVLPTIITFVILALLALAFGYKP